MKEKIIHIFTDESEREMNERDQDVLLFYAFRYALGRKSYSVDDVIDLLIKYKEIISFDHRQRICKEIDWAIDRDAAGMDCDVKQWQRLLSELNELHKKEVKCMI